MKNNTLSWISWTPIFVAVFRFFMNYNWNNNWSYFLCVHVSKHKRNTLDDCKMITKTLQLITEWPPLFNHQNKYQLLNFIIAVCIRNVFKSRITFHLLRLISQTIAHSKPIYIRVRKFVQVIQIYKLLFLNCTGNTNVVLLLRCHALILEHLLVK